MAEAKTWRLRSASEPAYGAALIAEWRDNWPTGIATMIGLGLGASILSNLFSLFIFPLQRAFGWSRGEIAIAQNIAILSIIVTPVIGRQMDRRGVRMLLLGGFGLMTLFWTGLALMPGSLPLYYALYAGLSLSAIPTSGLGFSRAMTRVFIRSRGLSLAIGRSGLALAAGLLPLLLFAVIDHQGWRSGYALMAALTALLAIPATWFGIERRRPARGGEKARPEAPILPWRKLVTSSSVILIALGAMLSYMPLLAIISQLHPLLVGKGFQPADAAGAVGLLGIAALGGALFTGILLDRLWAPLVSAFTAAGAAAGALCLLYAAERPWLGCLGVLLLGVAQGTEIDLIAYLVARYHGPSSFGSIFGLTSAAVTVGMVIGMTAIGQIYDRTQSYDLALAIAILSFILSGVAHLALGRYPKPGMTTD